MARRPLLLEGPSGGVQVLDLGGGGLVLTVILEGEAASYALAPEEARQLARYLEPQRERAPSSIPGAPKSRRVMAPRGTVDYAAVARVWSAAAATGARLEQSVADHFGIPISTARGRITEAKKQGLIPSRYAGVNGEVAASGAD